MVLFSWSKYFILLASLWNFTLGSFCIQNFKIGNRLNLSLSLQIVWYSFFDKPYRCQKETVFITVLMLI